jgi:hypothetical protein
MSGGTQAEDKKRQPCEELVVSAIAAEQRQFIDVPTMNRTRIKARKRHDRKKKEQGNLTAGLQLVITCQAGATERRAPGLWQSKKG